MTITAPSTPRAATLSHDTAMRLAATEYQRFLDLLRALSPSDWARPTECPGWDVRAMVAHALGMVEMAASLREQYRQFKLARDPWMHRADIRRATGADQVLTAEHDGVLVADVVAEWAAGHGRPYTLRLTGPAGGSWKTGDGGPLIETDAVGFCRALSGRDHADGLLTVQVPF